MRGRAEELEKKLLKASFTYEDYVKQMAAVKRMGPLEKASADDSGDSQLPNLDSRKGSLRKSKSSLVDDSRRKKN